MNPLNTLLDVLRLLADGLVRVGGISETDHRRAHEVINENDQEVQDARAKAAAFSDDDAAELQRLLDKQRKAEAPAEPAAEVPASPLLPGTPAQAPAAPGGPF